METTAVEAAKTLPVEEPVVQPILSLSDLVAAVEVIQSRENADRLLIQTLTTIDENDLRARLITWATLGFPNVYALYSLQLNRMEKCSDGIVRNDLLDYVQYLDSTLSITDTLAKLEAKLPGMSLSYSYGTDFTLRIHVTRK